MIRRLLRLACLSTLTGCFQDTGPDGGGSETSSETEVDTSSNIEGVESASGEDVTESESEEDDTSGDMSSEESSDSGTEDSSSGDDGTESKGTGSSSSEICDEEPVEVPVDDEFAIGDTRTFYLDFDDFPGIVGETAELCITFTTTNYASMRTITIGGADGEAVGFGPCGPLQPDPGPFTFCKPYVKPEGLVEVIIDNSTATPGCQNGPMDDLVLQFGCFP